MADKGRAKRKLDKAQRRLDRIKFELEPKRSAISVIDKKGDSPLRKEIKADSRNPIARDIQRGAEQKRKKKIQGIFNEVQSLRKQKKEAEKILNEKSPKNKKNNKESKKVENKKTRSK